MDETIITGRLRNAGLDLRHDVVLSPIYKNFKKLEESSISDRYREFLFKTRPHGFSEIEQLVPFVEVPFSESESERVTRANGKDDSARQLLSAFPAKMWGYYMPLSPNLSTLGTKHDLVGAHLLSKYRSEYRLNFIWKGVQSLVGGDLKNKTVLDIACNWGGFSIEGSLRGAKMTAFDIRPDNIAKAKALTDHFGINNIDFGVSDLHDYPSKDQFDIVLNLGLMYHISQPFEAMKKTYELTREFAVIDTALHREPFSGFILGSGAMAAEHAATAIGVELHPTYRALIDLAYLVGFKRVVELKGLPNKEWTDFAADPYGNGTRRCIVAFK